MFFIFLMDHKLWSRRKFGQINLKFFWIKCYSSESILKRLNFKFWNVPFTDKSREIRDYQWIRIARNCIVTGLPWARVCPPKIQKGWAVVINLQAATISSSMVFQLGQPCIATVGSIWKMCQFCVTLCVKKDY